MIDLDVLRLREPDPWKRLIWLMGAFTATMRGTAAACRRAADTLDEARS